ncbi:MAG: hypothetical protein ACI81R_001577 [Bradymonadia bacterium]|jgi:hypothetical protein
MSVDPEAGINASTIVTPPGGASRRKKRPRNHAAMLALFCGISSWVPLIIVITGPLTFLFALIALVLSVRSGHREQLNMAGAGVILALCALAIQGGFTLLAGGLGWAGAAIGCGAG